SPVMNVLLSLLLRQLERAFSRKIPDAQVEVRVVDCYGARTARVFISSPTASARSLTKIFAREINELCDNWISSELLDCVCSDAMIEKLDKYEKSDNAALEIAWQLVGRGGDQDVSSRILDIGMTTSEDVRCMAERLFRGSRVTYIVATSSKDECYSYKELLMALRSEFLIEDSDE
ncbi:MAG: hypothetical protein J6W96_01910, partial [Alphaproteobacteria bacterium]|nr:hypothetical protein [Alphaproteobacteria bacterium]